MLQSRCAEDGLDRLLSRPSDCNFGTRRLDFTWAASAGDVAFLKIADALFVGFRARLTPPRAPVGRASPIHERSTRQHGEAMIAGIGTRAFTAFVIARLARRNRVNAENARV
jgi:hypothetical protein